MPRHLGAWVVLLVIVALVLGRSVWHRVEQDRLRQPLEVVQSAAQQTHRPVAVLSAATARRWTDGDGPSQQEVAALARAGNPYLEPAYYYYSSRHGPGAWVPGADATCYYFAAQHGAEFDAGRVSALVQLCYVGKGRSAYGSGWTAVQ
jgi:hypothetical protein